MATVVETSEEDAALTVVRFVSELAWADAGPEAAEPQVNRLCVEAQECMVMGRWVDLASLMLASTDVIFSKVSEKDLECVFTIICNLVTKSGNPDESFEIAKVISAKIGQQPNDKPALRLKILFNLYNLLENPYSRFYVYMKALDLSLKGKVPEHIIPSLKKIDSFLREWNIGIIEQRELFLAISDVLKGSKSSANDYFKFLTKYLATFTGEDDLNEAKEEAAHAIVEFIKAPNLFKCDLLDMPAVGQLEKDTKYSLVYQLLKIFLTQRLDAYLEFQAANSTLLKSYGLVHEDCIAKMRLLSLVDLGSNESARIPYALIKDTLRINDDEVELWVVKAITSKLIDCKMDQMNEVVIVSRCSDRVFGQHQWETLRAKLATWRGNIANVIGTIRANKVVEDGSQGVQGLAIR
ncbi:Eukaryotic translation initiation factor 3 subunit M, partial [Cucurbita argyrosperma subsp. argyrosperma]